MLSAHKYKSESNTSRYFNNNVRSHEGGLHKGHTVKKHIKAYAKLAALAENPRSTSSAFFEETIANRALMELFVRYDIDIEQFQNDNNNIDLLSRRCFEINDLGYVVGNKVIEGVKGMHECRGVRMIICKTMDGPKIVTSFPILSHVEELEEYHDTYNSSSGDYQNKWMIMLTKLLVVMTKFFGKIWF